MNDTDRATATDDATQGLARALERHFVSFLAHAPHNPGTFWRVAADLLIDQFATTLPDTTEAQAQALETAAECVNCLDDHDLLRDRASAIREGVDL